eukprot:3854383-Pyramimonas_sp.AAC.1
MLRRPGAPPTGAPVQALAGASCRWTVPAGGGSASGASSASASPRKGGGHLADARSSGRSLCHNPPPQATTLEESKPLACS